MSSSSSRRTKKRPSSSSLAALEARDWAALPSGPLLDVFLRLDARDIMLSVEVVCKGWRGVAVEEPTLWRHVDMTAFPVEGIDTETVVRDAVDRSAGLMESFSGPWDDPSLSHIADGAPSLKSLHLSYDEYASDESLVETIKKLPLLVDLDISPPFRHICTSDKLFVSVCKACPLLKDLKIRITMPPDFTFGEALLMEWCEDYIHRTPVMCELRTIELFYYVIDSEHLTAILDNCPLLESLHIIGYNIEGEMDAKVQAKCARLKSFTLRNFDSSEENAEHSDFSEGDDCSD